MKTKFISVEENKEEIKTIFTHYLSGGMGWKNATSKPSSFEKVLHLGKCKAEGDMFVGYSENNEIYIYKGVKGSEFN